MRRALLVFNPEATSVSPRVRDVIAHALEAELKLDIAETKRRHHATHLARGAAHEGFDAVAVLGGDGTLNEVVNGLAGTDIPVIPLPGGGTNVFARTLGLPKDPIEATSVILEHLHEGRPPRHINLGSVNGRAFAFCAGVGYDAAVVRAVERRFRLKQRIGESYFVLQALRILLPASRWNPPMRIECGGETIGNLHEVIVGNSNPFTFLGRREFKLCPRAELDAGLDVTALTSMRTPTLVRIALSAFGSGKHIGFRSVRALHDVDRFTVLCDRPLPYQVDGDFAGEGTRFEFESRPRALSVLV